MIKCHVCDSTFKNNKGGQLTSHLELIHNLTYADWIVAVQLDGVEPRCECGLCEERPRLLCDKFQKFASFHNRFDVRERLWRAKHGDPKCKRCGNNAPFYRGEPREHCSQKCAMVGKGFANPETQKKITEVVRERYGVDNVSQVAEVRSKISESGKGKHSMPRSDDVKEQIGNASKARWSDPDYKVRTSIAIKQAVNSPEERARRSKKMTEQMSDPEFQKVLWSNHKNRLTKMHQRMRVALGLDELGFVPEQRIGRRWVDELNEEKKIVIEFNGDYTHANPKFYAADDVIHLKGQSYTASEKWKQDEEKLRELQALGYRVVTVWESDDLGAIRKIITNHEASFRCQAECKPAS